MAIGNGGGRRTAHSADSAAAGVVKAAIDALFSAWNTPDAPGAAVVVVRDGLTVYRQGYGCANLEYNIPITPSTPFHIASVSKQFTAFAIALLIQQGRLALDDDVRTHVPEVPDFGATITIRHLIHHTSGLRCKWELMELAGWRRDDVFTRQQVLKMIKHQKGLNFPPGSEHLYSNIGYFLLAEVVERVTGQSLRHYSDANIFGPLGMSHTHVHDDHEMPVKNMAYSYSPDPSGGFRKCVLSTAYAGSSSLYTTATDLARWLLNLDDGRVGGPAVLSQIQERGVLDGGKQISYAWGLYVGERDGLRMIYHSGGTAGYRSHLVWFPERRLGIAVLSNLSTFLAERLALQVADVCLGTRFVQDVPTMDRDPGAYAAYVGAYLLPNGLLVRVEKEGGHLLSRMLGYPELELAPVSADRFIVSSLPDVQGSFARDAAGNVQQLTIHQQGVDVPCRKIELPTLAHDRLSEYAGTYVSEELGTSYTLAVQQGQLVAQHRRHEDSQLTCTGEDRFAGFERGFGLVLFTRDAGGRVNGFSVSGERVRNVRFERQTGLH